MAKWKNFKKKYPSTVSGCLPGRKDEENVRTVVRYVCNLIPRLVFFAVIYLMAYFDTEATDIELVDLGVWAVAGALAQALTSCTLHFLHAMGRLFCAGDSVPDAMKELFCGPINQKCPVMFARHINNFVSHLVLAGSFVGLFLASEFLDYDLQSSTDSSTLATFNVRNPFIALITVMSVVFEVLSYKLIDTGIRFVADWFKCGYKASKEVDGAVSIAEGEGLIGERSETSHEMGTPTETGNLPPPQKS